MTTLRQSPLPRALLGDRPACRGHDPELFFADYNITERAREICWSCPVLQECREWAIPILDLYGLWGGMSAHERKAWRALRAADRRALINN